MTDNTTESAAPRLVMQPRRHQRVKAGHPWVYANEVQNDPALRQLTPGSLVTLENSGGEVLGAVGYNPKTLVVGRMIDHSPDAVLDADLIAARLDHALALRRRLGYDRHGRIVHAEADNLPGLILDRYGDVAVLQMNSAVMDLHADAVLAAVRRVLEPAVIALRNDSPARQLEGLGSEVRVLDGALDGPVTLEENGVRFLADMTGGQKTGWFYDQRENRAAVAALSHGARVLDCFCYLGGFGIQAAVAGADQVVLADRSEGALALAERAASLNGVGEKVSTEREAVFPLLERLAKAGESFDVVVVDPPAFVKSRKDLAAGLRGYRKMVRLAAAIVAPGGLILAGSCSHNVDPDLFGQTVRQGLADARRNGRILRSAGAGADHPVHPFLPESAYLKIQLIQLD